MKKFLIEKYGKEQGKQIWYSTQQRIEVLLSDSKLATSKNRCDTLKNTILPRIALYLVLQDLPMEKADAYAVIREYLQTVVCTKMSKQYQRLENIPAFYYIFQRIFIQTTLTEDLWDATLEQKSKEDFAIDIHKCLWYDACVENKCPEICKLFCECDDENYGHLRKIGFHRTGSIGNGNEKCDFKFTNRKYQR